MLPANSIDGQRKFINSTRRSAAGTQKISRRILSGTIGSENGIMNIDEIQPCSIETMNIRRYRQ